MPRVEVIADRCKGCGLCVIHCPKENLSIGEAINAQGYAHVVWEDGDGRCTGCSFCAQLCPDIALMVFKEEKN